ncbi:hypothetical protein C7420_101699 [Pantoea ananatis]|uniref:hypothetical protein n=1 Tax=Pantoea ananas TaxID=553 RepID=UPI000DC202D1|nr:hypothetical protein [Pantoea ananatis]RAR75083.1 hypothetical protein C7420_101699 [Pantoea ananatis]
MELMKGLEIGIWAIFIALVIFVFRHWFKAAIESSVKLEGDLILEKIKQANSLALDIDRRNYEVRMKSALIAELMAEWVSKPQDQRKLRQLTNEAFLWLPADLADDLSKVLSKKEDAITYHEFFSRVRKHLLGDDDKLEAYKFITYDLSPYEIAEIARKNIEAHSLVTFPESFYKDKPMAQGVSTKEE